nr:unnamed protein product [Callosobruchus chinensis]
MANTDFLDDKKGKAISRRSIERRKVKDKKFWFWWEETWQELNTKDSAADITEFRNPGKPGKKFKNAGKGNNTKQRLARTEE